MRTRAVAKREKQAYCRNLRDVIFEVKDLNAQIASFLTKEDQKRLVGASPVFMAASSKMETFVARKKALQAALKANGLSQLAWSTMRELEKRLKRYFTHGASSALDMVQKIKSFLESRDSKALREIMLKEKLGEKGLVMRSDSRLCKAYIMAAEDLDIEEVVSITALTKKQFAYGHQTWSHNHFRVEKILRDSVYIKGEDWDTALGKAEAAIIPIHYDSNEDSGEGSDFFEVY